MPVFVPHHHAPTARAQTLGGLLAETIAVYQRENGNITSSEIHQALQVAFAKSQEGRSSRPAAVVFMLAAVLLAGAIAAVTFARQRGETNENFLPFIFILMVVFAAVVLVTRLRRG